MELPSAGSARKTYETDSFVILTSACELSCSDTKGLCVSFFILLSV